VHDQRALLVRDLNSGLISLDHGGWGSITANKGLHTAVKALAGVVVVVVMAVVVVPENKQTNNHNHINNNNNPNGD
jgi:hypothetical protein